MRYIAGGVVLAALCRLATAWGLTATSPPAAFLSRSFQFAAFLATSPALRTVVAASTSCSCFIPSAASATAASRGGLIAASITIAAPVAVGSSEKCTRKRFVVSGVTSSTAYSTSTGTVALQGSQVGGTSLGVAAGAGAGASAGGSAADDESTGAAPV